MRQAARIYVAVGLGSGLGAVARYLVGLGTIALVGPDLPAGTLAVNVIGSFIIGLYATLTDPDGRLIVSPATRQFVLAGFCGGFTTFSIFSLETLRLAGSEYPHLAAANMAVSLVLWLGAAWLGHRIGLRLNRMRGM